VGEKNGQFGVKVYLLPTTRRARATKKKKEKKKPQMGKRHVFA
jgi:hypothetical protein|tara:strand:- start:5091 stop:5219 length:129 start_codon:yes stop_codon:yes gene_type:complete